MKDNDIVLSWLKKAEDDLENAKFLMENRWPRPVELVCYLCSQSVEKSLKAFIIYNDETPPYTHDLGLLCRTCLKYDLDFSNIVNDCLDITPYATQTRYPNNIEIEESETLVALKKTESIFNLCKDKAKNQSLIELTEHELLIEE